MLAWQELVWDFLWICLDALQFSFTHFGHSSVGIKFSMLLDTNLFAMLPASEEASYCVTTMVEEKEHPLKWKYGDLQTKERSANKVSTTHWVVLSRGSLDSLGALCWVCPLKALMTLLWCKWRNIPISPDVLRSFLAMLVDLVFTPVKSVNQSVPRF